MTYPGSRIDREPTRAQIAERDEAVIPVIDLRTSVSRRAHELKHWKQCMKEARNGASAGYRAWCLTLAGNHRRRAAAA